MWWIMLLDFWMLTWYCIPGLNPTCLWCTFLLKHFWIQSANILLKILHLCLGERLYLINVLLGCPFPSHLAWESRIWVGGGFLLSAFIGIYGLLTSAPTSLGYMKQKRKLREFTAMCFPGYWVHSTFWSNLMFVLYILSRILTVLGGVERSMSTPHCPETGNPILIFLKVDVKASSLPIYGWKN